MTEQTALSPAEEVAFKRWAMVNNIQDVDDPRSKYDYRGYWKQTQGAAHQAGEHFPDTFKQHGHPTFSQESQYSAGPFDGGRWIGEQFIPNGADLQMNSRGQSRIDPNLIAQAVMALKAMNR